MKATKLMAVALCAAACTTATLFAEDDFGIETASPVKIADPVNPQPGMVLSGYKVRNIHSTGWIKDCFTDLPKTPAIKTAVDKAEDFSLKPLGKTQANVGMWSGFMKCKRACVYTIAFSESNVHCIYALRINGRTVITMGKGQSSVDVPLKVGWNKIEFACLFYNKNILNMSYKPKESLSEARPLTPMMIFHEQKPEEAW